MIRAGPDTIRVVEQQVTGLATSRTALAENLNREGQSQAKRVAPRRAGRDDRVLRFRSRAGTTPPTADLWSNVESNQGASPIMERQQKRPLTSACRSSTP